MIGRMSNNNKKMSEKTTLDEMDDFIYSVTATRCMMTLDTVHMLYTFEYFSFYPPPPQVQ